MVIIIYVSETSASKEIKKRQQRVKMILECKHVDYACIDISEPGKESDKQFLQEKCNKCKGAPFPAPPQIFNDDDYCGDFEAFDLANENDSLEEFLKLEESSLSAKKLKDGLPISNSIIIDTIESDLNVSQAVDNDYNSKFHEFKNGNSYLEKANALEVERTETSKCLIYDLIAFIEKNEDIGINYVEQLNKKIDINNRELINKNHIQSMNLIELYEKLKDKSDLITSGEIETDGKKEYIKFQHSEETKQNGESYNACKNHKELGKHSAEDSQQLLEDIKSSTYTCSESKSGNYEDRSTDLTTLYTETNVNMDKIDGNSRRETERDVVSTSELESHSNDYMKTKALDSELNKFEDSALFDCITLNECCKSSEMQLHSNFNPSVNTLENKINLTIIEKPSNSTNELAISNENDRNILEANISMKDIKNTAQIGDFGDKSDENSKNKYIGNSNDDKALLD